MMQKNLAKKIAIFELNKRQFCRKCDHNIDFCEKRQFFPLKIAKNRRKL
jgi:hypothetical protein